MPNQTITPEWLKKTERYIRLGGLLASQHALEMAAEIRRLWAIEEAITKALTAFPDALISNHQYAALEPVRQALGSQDAD